MKEVAQNSSSNTGNGIKVREVFYDIYYFSMRSLYGRLFLIVLLFELEKNI